MMKYIAAISGFYYIKLHLPAVLVIILLLFLTCQCLLSYSPTDKSASKQNTFNLIDKLSKLTPNPVDEAKCNKNYYYTSFKTYNSNTNLNMILNYYL